MGQIGEMIVVGARRYRDLAAKLFTGIDAAHFAQKPTLDGRCVNTNHPAWICGHLSLYPARVFEFVHADPAPAAVPGDWETRFGYGSECVDDPEGARYPSMAELTAAYMRAYDAVLDRVLRVDDAVFAGPTPIEPYRNFLPTIGSATMSMLNNHVAFHLGQLSTWRRCMGYGSVM